MSYLQNCRELSAFCSQNGWIINESIHYEVLQQQNQVLIYTTFLESIMEGSVCQCDLKSCYGRMQLTLDEAGQVMSSMVV
jgi:hypothetical protein